MCINFIWWSRPQESHLPSRAEVHRRRQILSDIDAASARLGQTERSPGENEDARAVRLEIEGQLGGSCLGTSEHAGRIGLAGKRIPPLWLGTLDAKGRLRALYLVPRVGQEVDVRPARAAMNKANVGRGRREAGIRRMPIVECLSQVASIVLHQTSGCG